VSQQQTIEKLWQHIRDPKQITLLETLGIEIDYIGADAIRGSMPVDQRTKQYYGMLHGGASVAFAETLASLASLLHIDMTKDMIVGLEINANHIRSATGGRITGEGKPLHIGAKTQIWSIEMKNEQGKLLCISRCTIAVVPKRE
jgi:1,4-dihydroxy-2-naphthoyl-CoA hydrolase